MSTDQQNTAETQVDDVVLNQDSQEIVTETVEQADVQTEADDNGAAADAVASIDSVQQALAEALATIEAQKESVLRNNAEMDNVRKRAAREVENASRFALEKFAKEIVVVVDNLERALDVDASGSEQDQAMREGIELTLKTTIGILEKFNISMLDPMGEAFNPEFHEAMSMVPNPEVPANHVMAVMQKGYTLNGRLLRPAMVIISRG